MKREVLLLLTDKWNDWEASYAIAVINAYTEEYVVKTISLDGKPQVSMGGLCTEVDYSISTYSNYDNLAMLIIPGGLAWEEGDFPEIAEYVSKVYKKNIKIAAICGATLFLCRNGFLNDITHTGDNLELFLAQKKYGYSGERNYKEQKIVVDKIITAKETAAVEFAYEIFKELKIDSPEEIEEWYENFK